MHISQVPKTDGQVLKAVAGIAIAPGVLSSCPFGVTILVNVNNDDQSNDDQNEAHTT
jgi:hypothetical protein